MSEISARISSFELDPGFFKLGGGSIRLTVSLPLTLTRNHIGDISRM
jgi:hypothetical protein